jgi:hypothetical protein
LEIRVADLKSRMADLKSRMADLESRLADFLAQSLEGIGLFQRMTPAKRLFEERDHVALYASSRPTLPHTLVQEIIHYLNRQLFFLLFI